jgi:hypothetical protein
MKSSLGRLLVGLSLLGIAIGPGALGSARAVALPGVDACTGAGATSPDYVTGIWKMNGGFSCLLHQYNFDGSTSSGPLSLCPGSGLSDVSFQGTVTRDDGATASAVWTILGASGVYALSMNSGLGTFVGAVAPYELPCSPNWVPFNVVAARISTSSPVPELLSCQATGTAGPNAIDWGPVTTFGGAASGSGVCRSATAETWDLSYDGSWQEGYGGNAWCPGHYLVNVTVTNRSNGEMLTQQQYWAPQNGQKTFQIETLAPLTTGVGTISESPDSCTYPASMTTSTNLVFTIAG